MSNDLEGSLNCFTLSDILQLLGFSGQTGTLTLKQGWNTRTICFEKGRLTYIAATTRLATIGELLLRAGKLTQQQLQAALVAAEQSDRDLAAILLELGWATADDLKHCQDQLLEETIYSLFLWRNCRFTFDSGVLDKANGFAIDIATERLVIDGTRRVDEWIDISSVVPSMRMTFLASSPLGSSPGDSAAATDLSEQDRRVLEQIDNRRDGVAIALACGLTQFETARSLAQLSRAGLAQAKPPERSEITRLFTVVVESIYLKLTMFGHARLALDLQEDLGRFGRQHRLNVRMNGGRIVSTDEDSDVDPMSLIDLYKLFIAIQQNRFARMFEPAIANGLLEGLYRHANPEDKELLRIYEFYHLEGLIPFASDVRLSA